MKTITKFASYASIAAIAASNAVPAFAYFRTTDIPGYVAEEKISDDASGARRVTSRSIRGSRKQYRLNSVIGDNRTDEHLRDEAGGIGLAYTKRPVRGAWRRVGLRGERRRILARMRGGHYRRVRRGLQVQFDREALLPASLVTTGDEDSYPNWRSWARGRDEHDTRDLNGANRGGY